jgi:hypothetical protein
MIEAITTGVITAIGWTIILTALIVRMRERLSFLEGVRMKTMEQVHNECRAKRIEVEEKLAETTTSIDKTLATLKNDIKWIKKSIANGHPVPMNEDEEDD